MTPLFPSYFLLLATLAHVAKSIAYAAYLSTSVRIAFFYSSILDFYICDDGQGRCTPLKKVSTLFLYVLLMNTTTASDL